MPDPFPDHPGVSRETLEKLTAFEGLLRTWSRRINLVSASGLENLWQRHICDSAQLLDLTDNPEKWLDLGSGGGFPGLVIGILMQDQFPAARITLVESDMRKCAFLKTVARRMELAIDIRAQRIETLEPRSATTVTARALAPLDQLVAYTHRHLATDGTALFPKGRKWKNELQQAKEKWSFDCDVLESVTDVDAAILRLRNIQRK